MAGPHCKFDSDKRFHKVIVASGAASVQVLNNIHSVLPWQLIPIKGFAIAESKSGLSEYRVPTEERMVGIEFEEASQYIRAQEDGGIRYGFGRVVGSFEDELYDPRFENWEDECSPRNTGLGRAMLKSKATKRLAGFRPFGALGNFPTMKAYTNWNKGVFLNTGFGFYGYGMTWLSSKIVADVVLTGETSEEWKDSVEFTEGFIWGIHTLLSPTSWSGPVYFGIIAVLLLVCCFAVYRMCMRASKETSGSSDDEAYSSSDSDALLRGDGGR